jgi:hypothetical protein
MNVSTCTCLGLRMVWWHTSLSLVISTQRSKDMFALSSVPETKYKRSLLVYHVQHLEAIGILDMPLMFAVTTSNGR